MSERTYSESEIIERLACELPHWYYENGWIRRKYRTSGWKATLMVVNAIGHLAEAAWHHPDLTVSYAFVIVKLVTHSAKGVTDKDFALARKIEQFVQWDAADETGGLLPGSPDDPRYKYVRRD
ncbi:MAG: 4a-hydroxytetrahydrobiopterin dehydratase [Methylotetracoccus sp.]